MSAYSGIYTDMSGLAQLRARSERQPESALNEVAGQFEAVFTRMMLKSMRSSSLGDSLLEGKQNQQYLEMFDNQIAVEMSRGRGLGLKQILIRQLGGDTADDVTPRGVSTHSASAQITGSTSTPSANWEPESPEAFINELLPFARDIEADLGISHRAVLAHAALESGWGRHTLRRADGGNAFNVFGIKADSAWQGERVSVKTLEFRDGLARQETAGFRAYRSLDHAMADYADFIRNNPRYSQAIAAGADPHAYAMELQRAGYATDPAYADKLSAVIESVSARKSVGPITAQYIP